MVDKITKLLLLLSPIVYGVNINLDKFSLRFFQIGVMMLFVASLFDKPKRDINIETPIAVLIGLVILNSFIHLFQPIDLGIAINLFFGIIAIVIISGYLKDHRACYKYIYWAVCINLAVMVFQKIGYSPIISFGGLGENNWYTGCEGGMFGNSSRLAMYMALIVPFVWEFSTGLFVALIVAILLCGEHNVLFPLGVFLIFKAKGKKRIVTTLITVFIFFLYRSHYVASLIFRWNNAWKEPIRVFFKQPFLGHGLGKFYLLYGHESFNSYLPFVFGIGILGAVWIGWVIHRYRRDLISSTEGLAVMTFLILCLYEYVIEVPRLWFTVIFILSAFIINERSRHVDDLCRQTA